MGKEENAFGARLGALRRAAHMTQAALGRHFGVTCKAVSRWETGESEPPLSYLPRLAALLSVSVDTLLGTVPHPTVDSAEEGRSPAALSALPRKKHTGGNLMHWNFIPEEPCFHGGYLCTWALQQAIADAEHLPGSGTVRQRDVMDEKHLFGENSRYHTLSPRVRGDVCFLLDDGWDVPYGTTAAGRIEDGCIAMFGSLEADGGKFPSFGRTPQERLGRLSDEMKKLGYAGLGLWVSPQRPFYRGDERGDEAGARAYWEMRARESEAAGVRYWKVDWGLCSEYPEYRGWMTDAVRRAAPHLLIEHAVGQGPYTGVRSPDEPAAAAMRTLLAISDYFRTYDVMAPFADSATLCRVDAILRRFDAATLRPDCAGYLNVEGRAAVAAGLGCTIGIMRPSPAAEACLRWQRIAPPISVRDASYACSEERLTDSYYFTADPIWWLPYAGKDYDISAPAVMARGTRLPHVACSGLRPFVLASEKPENGAYAVSALRRTVDPNAMMIAPAAVTIYPSRLDAPIGVFGYYDKLTVEYPAPIPERCTVFAQALTSDCAEIITDAVKISGNRMEIDGRVLRYHGLAAHGEGNAHDPALLLLLRC